MYTECATSCPKTCQNKNQNFDGIECKSECSPGCVCPEGYFLDAGQNGTCVREESCTCTFREIVYQSNDKVNVDCNEW